MNNMSEDYIDDIPDWYQPENYAPDQYFLDVKEEIKRLYNSDKESIYYIRQLQVKFEKKYFHWLTYNAIESLLKEKFLVAISKPVSEFGTPIQFLAHKSNRYPKRNVNEMAKIISAYSHENITKSCGHRAEDLFALALASHGFQPKKKKVNEYNNIKWTRSKHDLDYVFERDDVSYGCEIKNTLGYIDKDELEIKLEMCKFLKIKPLFILRFAPKTYIEMIRLLKGFTMIFECQIYELSQRDLVGQIKSILGLPVDCPKSIPEGIITRFENWHNKSKNL